MRDLHLKLKLLVTALAPGQRLRRSWPLDGGSSTQMTGFEIADGDGQVRRYVLRHHAGARLASEHRKAEAEFRLHQWLPTLGLPVPAVVHLDQTGEIFPGPILVLEYRDGRLDFSREDLGDRLDQMALQLARIHRIDLTIHELAFLQREGGGCAEMLRAPLERNDVFLNLATIRELLCAAGAPGRANSPALLHGDYWPGNLLWYRGELAAVVDWEDATVADPLVELARSRSEIAWLFGPDACHRFTERYFAANEIDATALAYWDLCAALRVERFLSADLPSLLAFYGRHGRSELSAETIRKDLNRFAGEAVQHLAAR